MAIEATFFISHKPEKVCSYLIEITDHHNIAYLTLYQSPMVSALNTGITTIKHFEFMLCQCRVGNYFEPSEREVMQVCKRLVYYIGDQAQAPPHFTEA